MKQYITMLSMNSGGYRIVERLNNDFFCIVELFSFRIKKNTLIEWFYENKIFFGGNDYLDIRKKDNFIKIYNLKEQYFDETKFVIELDEDKKFVMTKENFLHIITQWEELRTSRPDIILVVIHEDNHVSLETDPVIIKEYQDAGYAFDYNKEKK